MKSARMLLVPAILLIALATGGCQDEDSEPKFTRVSATPSCGVAPLDVDFFSAVSGGNETGDPMGGNNLLEIKWNFGDGSGGNTSINFHKYTVPGEYTVTVTAQDQDGKNTSRTVPVTVLADSLVVEATSSPPSGTVTTGDRILFLLDAKSCNIDFPAVAGDSVKMTYRWEMGDAANTVYTGANPIFTYGVAGNYTVDLFVTSPRLAVTRRTSLDFTVVDPIP
ncbi:MAG: PKD repeat protein [Candidatus Krumholzibacteriia bacterium]|jgi:PKD repeat protein